MSTEQEFEGEAVVSEIEQPQPLSNLEPQVSELLNESQAGKIDVNEEIKGLEGLDKPQNKLKLKRIGIQGFKSFADQSEIELPEGLTAIVGPNGCGKSNIVDAIRWVMGEQRARSIRADSMSDVLFMGAEGRRPAPMAEVVLYFEGKVADANWPFESFEVCRRLFRTGESEYRINQKVVRLKDVHHLFLDSGIGKNAFAIFEQGKIEQLVAMSPAQRRLMVEEAAGITRYKERKRESVKKWEQAQSNLDRIKDVYGDLEGRLAHLERQAEEARDYKSLQNQLHMLEKQLVAKKYCEEEAKRAEYKMNQEQMGNQHQAQKEQLEALEKTIEELTQALEAAQDERHESYEALSEAKQKRAVQNQKKEDLVDQITRSKQRASKIKQESDSRKEQVESDAQVYDQIKAQAKERHEQVEKKRALISEIQGSLYHSERACKEARLEIEKEKGKSRTIDTEYRVIKAKKESVEAQIRKLSQRESELENNERNSEEEGKRTEYDEAKASHAELSSEIEKKTSQKRDLEERVDSSKTQVEEKREAVLKAQSDFDSLNLRLNLLKDLDREGFGLGNSVQKLREVSSNSAHSLYQRVLPFIDLPSLKNMDKENLDQLQHLQPVVFVSSLSNVRDFLQFCKDESVEDYALVCLEVFDLGSSSIHQQASQWVEQFAPKQGANISFLSRIKDKMAGWWCDDEDPELKVRIDSFGIVWSSITQKENRLNLKVEKEQLSEKYPAFKELVEQARRQKQEVDASFQEKKEALSRVLRELSQLEQREKETGRKVDNLEGWFERLEEKKRMHAAEKERLSQEKERLNQELKEMEESLCAFEKQLEAFKSRGLQLEEKLQREYKEKNEISSRFDHLNNERHLLDKQLRELESNISMIEQKRSVFEEVFASLMKELKGEEERVQGLEKEAESIDEYLESFEMELEEWTKRHEACTQNVSRVQEEQNRTKRERQELIDHLSPGEEHLQKVSIALAQSEVVLKALEEESLTRFELPVEELDIIDERKVSQIDRDVKKLKKAIEAMGEVNLTAIEECEQMSTKRRRVHLQIQDIEQSQGELMQVIAHLDRECKKRFKATFDQVKESFQKNFQLLFNGGEADLVLTAPVTQSGPGEEEGGVEILACPPQKKLKSLSLLSGGEKCLTSIAMMFALFDVRPAPFCLLDEIDAPLDDANVQRFLNLIEKEQGKSQFFIITHNRRTMEAADSLIGVSMQVRGVSKILSLKMDDKQAQVNA